VNRYLAIYSLKVCVRLDSHTITIVSTDKVTVISFFVRSLS
jgi:hypothetical protein